jgi:hypothetical protein
MVYHVSEWNHHLDSNVHYMKCVRLRLLACILSLKAAIHNIQKDCYSGLKSLHYIITCKVYFVQMIDHQVSFFIVFSQGRGTPNKIMLSFDSEFSSHNSMSFTIHYNTIQPACQVFIYIINTQFVFLVIKWTTVWKSNYKPSFRPYTDVGCSVN